MKKALVWGLLLVVMVGLAPGNVGAQGMGYSYTPPPPPYQELPAVQEEPAAPPYAPPPYQTPEVYGDGYASSDVEPCLSPPGELILVDALVMRPIGIAACVIGLAGALVTIPFAAASNSQDRVAQSLIVQPFEYTFKRPLGTMNYDPCDPYYK
jgi:hypothetical protein